MENTRLQRNLSKAAAALLAAAALSLPGCGLVNTESPFWATVGSIGGTPPNGGITRAQVDAIPYATALAWFEGAPPAVLVLGDVEPAGRLVWYASGGQAVVTRDGRVVGTAGFDPDLNDMRLEGGRAGDFRTLMGSRALKLVTAQRLGRFEEPRECVYAPVGDEQVTILERERVLLRVDEECRTPGGKQEESSFWVDRADGAVWKQRVWLLPELPVFNFEILRPFGQHP